jgi:hypothetical protein
MHARPAAPAPVRQRAFVSAAARSDGPPLQRWEDEGGHYSADDEPVVETDRGKRAAAGLSWSEFLSRFFPGRRRHDLEALQAYATYRSEGTPAPSRGIRLPVAVSQKSRKEATS